jgi:hypothetical protein
MPRWNILGAGALASLLLAGGCGRQEPSVSSRADAPREWFQDITAASGLAFTHVTGTNYFMGDQVGSGVALFDCDNDGRLDV